LSASPGSITPTNETRLVVLSHPGNVHTAALETAGASQVVAAELSAAKEVLEQVLHLYVTPEEQK
jgi:hypothetical protein